MRRDHYATAPDFSYYDWDALFDRLAGRKIADHEEAHNART